MNPSRMQKQSNEDPDGHESIPAEKPISLLEIMAVLFHKRRFLAWMTLVSATVSMLIAFVWPPTYAATTTLLPPQQNNSFSSMLISQLGALGSLGASASGALKNSTDLYVGLLKSETVEYSVIARFDLAREYHVKRPSDARKELEEHVQIDGSQKDGLIRITANARSAEHAAEIANGYVLEYRHLSASLAISEASQRRLFLEQQLQKAKSTLASAEEDLKHTEQTTGMLQLDAQARALIESAGSLRAQIAAKEVQVQSMRTYAGDGNVDLKEAEQQLSGLRAQLAKLGGSSDAGGDDIVLPKGRLPEAGLEYIRKLREVKYNETLFEIIARQYEAAKLDEAKEGAIVQVVDVARVPDRKSGPQRILIIGLGISAGLILAILTIFLKRAQKTLASEPEYRLLFNRSNETTD